MRERYKLILRKIQNELKPSGFKESESITFYRLISFIFSKQGIQRIGRIFQKAIRVLFRIISGKKGLAPAYSKWLKKYLKNKKTSEEVLQDISSWNRQPLISIIMPVFNPQVTYLHEAIESVKDQLYSNWELCISDDCSNDETIAFLKELEGEDERIKIVFRKENGNISVNMNSAATMATGEYLCFLDQDDLLAKDALYFVSKNILKSKADILYSDEDKIDKKNIHSDPFFKPGWSPHSLLSRNYINHLLTIRKSVFDKLNGFRKGFEGAQDHDLLLRAAGHTDKIVHIPEILYHWRMHSDSTAFNTNSKNWAFEAGEKAIEEYYTRIGFKAKSTNIKQISGNYKTSIELKNNPKVSILIPTKDKASVLKICLDSLFRLTTWTNYEVIVINNNSEEESTQELFRSYQLKYPEKFRVEAFSNTFNFSDIQNFGANKAKGEYLLLLNNDTEIISPNWIEHMLSYAQLPNVGAVGVKLLFPNKRLQHVGVLLGIRGIVGHAFVGSDNNNSGYFQSNRVTTNYSAVTAACLMVEKKKFVKVNGFDSKLAIEYNDVDFCLKLYDSGLFNVFLPDVELTHYESLTRGHPSSTRESNQQSIKEGNYFLEKWKPLIEDDPFYNINLSRQYTEFQYDI